MSEFTRRRYDESSRSEHSVSHKRSSVLDLPEKLNLSRHSTMFESNQMWENTGYTHNHHRRGDSSSFDDKMRQQSSRSRSPMPGFDRRQDLDKDYHDKHRYADIGSKDNRFYGKDSREFTEIHETGNTQRYSKDYYRQSKLPTSPHGYSNKYEKSRFHEVEGAEDHTNHLKSSSRESYSNTKSAQRSKSKGQHSNSRDRKEVTVDNKASDSTNAKTSKESLSRRIIKREAMTSEEYSQLSRDCEERIHCLSSLESELSRLRQLECDLMRKKRWEKDGHKDPLIVENGRLQAAVETKMSEVQQIVTDLKAKLQLHAADFRQEKVKESEEEIIYEYDDLGNYWCERCDEISPNVSQMLKHLRSLDHTQKGQDQKFPWTTNEKKPIKNSKIIKEGPIKGAEFILPCEAFYCELCKTFFGDQRETELHLQSKEHHDIYRRYISKFFRYERAYEDRLKCAIKRKTKEAKQAEERLQSQLADLTPQPGSSNPKGSAQSLSTASSLTKPVKRKVPLLKFGLDYGPSRKVPVTKPVDSTSNITEENEENIDTKATEFSQIVSADEENLTLTTTMILSSTENEPNDSQKVPLDIDNSPVPLEEPLTKHAVSIDIPNSVSISVVEETVVNDEITHNEVNIRQNNFPPPLDEFLQIVPSETHPNSCDVPCISSDASSDDSD